MTVKIKNSGLYISKVNGKSLINNQYTLDIDSDRKKSNQVIGMFNNNGYIERMHDSLQNYMNKTSSKNQSIFDLLKREHSEVNKIPNIAIKILNNPPIQPIVSSPKKMVINKKNIKQKTKKRETIHNGISSKLFDFTSPVLDHEPVKGNNVHSRKKKRKRITYKNKNKNKKKL
jgi:hypothetical protein